MKSVASDRRGRLALGALVVVAVSALCPEARGQSTQTITFDELAPNTIVTTQYSAAGSPAVFNRGMILAGQPDPANHALASADLGFEFDAGPLVISFLSAQHAVSFDGTFNDPIGGNLKEATLTAFGSQGDIVAQDGPFIVIGGGAPRRFLVSTLNNEIKRIEFLVEDTFFELIDNLTFEGNAAPPSDGGQPVITFDFPQNGNVDATTLLVTGTIAGTNLINPAVLALDFQAPPGSATHKEIFLPLAFTGTPNVFRFTVAELQIPRGTDTITVRAETVFGASASASRTVVNLPPSVIQQCDAGLFGPFQYAVELPNCTFAICNSGGVSLGHGAIGNHVVTGGIKNKWLSVNDIRLGVIGERDLGCAVSNTIHLEQPAPAIRQDFERGRIYSVSQGLAQLYYVPKAFAQAMAVSGEETRVGLPVGDPVINTVALPMQTLWFQRFNRNSIDLGTTMEIRGNPAVLSVERQGGDLVDLTQAGIDLSAATATIWDRYPCQNTFTCDFSAAQNRTRVPPTREKILEQLGFCNDGVAVVPNCDGYPCVLGAGEWIPAESLNFQSNYNYKDLNGWIRKGGSHRSGSDWILTHSYGNDWIINVLPFVQYNSLLGANWGATNMETEIEYYYNSYFFLSTGFPHDGDLVFMNGRWILDCGHKQATQYGIDSFRTEIHPYALLALSRTVTFQNQKSTRTDIDVNGFFFSFPTKVVMYPPPRPSPNASLAIYRTRDQEAVLGNLFLNVEFFHDHVEVAFNGPTTLPPVEEEGEMFQNSGFRYYGTWQLVWQ